MKPSIVPGNSSYAETINHTEKIIIFGDSIPRDVSLNKFNSYINTDYAKIKSYGSDIGEIILYKEPKLKYGSFRRAIRNFLGLGKFVELVHFDKRFVENTRKKGPAGKNFGAFSLDTLKTTF